MPLYEYRCTNCDHVFDVFHEVGGTPGPCPVCGGAPRRIFTSVGLIFKGSGFHSTDYRKSAPPNGAQSKETSGQKTPAGKETSGQKTPAGKETSGQEATAGSETPGNESQSHAGKSARATKSDQ